MTIYDISIPLREGMAVWPGDTPYHFELGWKIAEGASVNVGAVTLSVHTGTHIDAPFHFDPHGMGAGELDLLPYCGPAVVVDVTGRDPIPMDAFAGLDFSAAPRLLLRTGAWTDHTHFPHTVPTLAPDVPGWLCEKGIALIGVDVPSVDALDSKDLPIHHALHDANIRILEGLDLSAVPPGIYELIALPLRLDSADGSPVRAILRR